MAAQPNASLPGGDTAKIVVAAVLVAIFAGIWAPRLLKKRRRSQPVNTTPAQPATATAAPTPVAAAAEPTARAATAASEASCGMAAVFADADKPPMELKRNPFAVSDALRKLMTNVQPQQEPAIQSAPGSAPSEAPDPLREARLWPLQATVIDGEVRYAMIDGEFVVEGQTFRGLAVKSVGEREVVLESPAGKLRLAMDKGEAR